MDRPSPPNPPSPLPPSAPVHRAPPEGWRPMSGLAVTAFVVSLVAIVPSWLGLWPASALALVLGVAAFALTDPAARRGRGLAVAAVAISLPLGIALYVSHTTLRDHVRDMGSHVLAALRGGDEAGLAAWIDEGARGEGAAERIRRRYAAAAEVLGPYEGPVEAGSPWLGAATVFAAPGAVEELGADGARTDGSDVPLGTVWVRTPFAKGTAHVAFLLKGGGGPAAGAADALADLAGKSPARVLTDVRFFRAR